MGIIKKYTIQIVPEEGEIKEINLSPKMVVFWLILICFIFLGTTCFLVIFSKLAMDKAEYNLLKKKIAYLENREIEIKKLNNRMRKLYDMADKLNRALGLELSLEEFYDNYNKYNKEERKTPLEVDSPMGEIDEIKEAAILHNFIPDILPTQEGWISKKFSPEHKAIDISLKEGTPLYSTIDGIVFSVEEDEYLGKTLEIRNDEGFAIFLGHLKEVLVKKGDNVKKNQLIALSGSSGKTEAPHLHYGVKVEGKWVDPSDYLLIRR
ncbi:MAG: peptidoglycan DD-metalloendopeptidase family protein [candidate division WOR-3 bacterium]